MSNQTTTPLAVEPGSGLPGEVQYRSYSQWQLIWMGFRKHRFAFISLFVVAAFYAVAIVCQFLAPYGATDKLDIPYAAPIRVRLVDADGTLHRPFVYALIKSRDPESFKAIYEVDTSTRYPIRFFVHGSEYKFVGLFKTNLHLFGVEAPGKLALFGTDNLGRDIFSRSVIATRISTSIGLISIAMSLVLGLIIGAASAYFGGVVDTIIQKIIEVIISIPSIPLWMGLAAALPKQWSALMVYFAITLILALRGWTGVARVVRGKFLSVREEDYIMASRNFGAGGWYIMIRHLIPNFMSYVIVSVTLSVPGMIIGETSLSFLGIGLRPPVVSWGVLLQGAQNIHSIVEYTWTLIPATLVIVIVLAFNFVGDGLRDAADPYSRR